MDMQIAQADHWGVRGRSKKARVAIEARTPMFFIGEWIDALRHTGIQQKDVAEAAGVSIPFMSQICNHERLPSVTVLLKISDFLKVSVDALRHPPPTRELMDHIRRIDAPTLFRLQNKPVED